MTEQIPDLDSFPKSFVVDGMEVMISIFPSTMKDEGARLEGFTVTHNYLDDESGRDFACAEFFETFDKAVAALPRMKYFNVCAFKDVLKSKGQG